MTVTYILERTGRTPHEIAARLLDWTVPGNGLPRGPSRCYLCTACGEIHPAQLVDVNGRPVASPGWGLSQELREREEGPDHHP